MPRKSDLKRELEIRRLRTDGMTVREIAKAVNASPSTVSRVLRKDPNRATLATQDERLQTLEKKMAVIAEALAVIANIVLQYHGPNPKNRLLEVLIQKWPDPYFKFEMHAGRL